MNPHADYNALRQIIDHLDEADAHLRRGNPARARAQIDRARRKAKQQRLKTKPGRVPGSTGVTYMRYWILAVALTALIATAFAGVALPGAIYQDVYTGAGTLGDPTDPDDPTAGPVLIHIDVLTGDRLLIMWDNQPPGKIYHWNASNGAYIETEGEDSVQFGPEDPVHGIPFLRIEADGAGGHEITASGRCKKQN